MLLHRFVGVCAVSLVVGFFAVAGVVRAEDSLWQTDFAAAKAQAKADNKLLLVDFTGSDWCFWCKKLVTEVFSKEAFKTEAPKKFVLVELDYPRDKKLPDELTNQNKQLAKQYKIKGYPTILVMDADGKVVATTGYRPNGPEEYVKHLAMYLEVYGDVLKMKKELDTVQGLDRAKLLDKLADAYATKLENDGDEVLAWSKEIVALDPDNKTGLKIKYQINLLMAEMNDAKDNRKFDAAKAAAEKMLALSGITGEQKQSVYLALCQVCRASGKIAEAKAVADRALAEPGISGEQKQGVYLALCECYFADRDLAKVIASAQKGIDAAPNGPQTQQLKSILQRFKALVAAQETVIKLKADMEKAKGLDRAKILDKMVEAAGKLGGMSQAVTPQDVEAWSKEIVALDADNKAGLKKKYEFRVLIAGANKLAAQKKTAECEAEIENALALPGVTADQIQEAKLTLATCYRRNGDLEKALEVAKKALDAAPKGPRSMMIKQYFIPQIEAQLKAKNAKKDAKK